MAAIISISIKKEDLDKLDPSKFIQGKTATYIPLSLFIDDKNDKYGNNVSMTLGQSEEERNAKAPKVYLGNGKVVSVKDGIKTAKDITASGPPVGSREPF
jgi:hypothetical protein